MNWGERSLEAGLPLAAKESGLRQSIHGYKRVVVALSGGVDSSLLSLVAHQELGENAKAVIAVSPSLSRDALEQARTVSRHIGIKLEEKPTNEVELSEYRVNDVNRCYYCRVVTFGAFVEANPGVQVVAGFQRDDLGEIRPGLLAARQLGIRFPLIDAGLGKDDARDLARRSGLPNWNSAADACLSSRFETGITISEETLSIVGEVEGAIRKVMGINNEYPIRVRVLSSLGIRLEVDESLKAIALAERERIRPILQSGFGEGISIYFGPYRSGSASRRRDDNEEY